MNISISFSLQEYKDCIINYFFFRRRILFLILILSGSAWGITLIKQVHWSLFVLVLILLVLYLILIFYLINKKTERIYVNTEFFHKTQFFSFDKEFIYWKVKTQKLALSKVQVRSTDAGLILILSHFHVIPIPYHCIDDQQWAYLSKLQVQYPQFKLSHKKYQQARGNNV